MTTEDQARKHLAQQRKHDEHVKDTLLNRADAEVHDTGDDEAIADERAREILTQQRQHNEHVKDTMLHRAEDETGQTH